MELFHCFYSKNPQAPYFGCSVGKGCFQLSKSQECKKISWAKIESDQEYSNEYTVWREYPVFTNPSHPSWNNPIKLFQGDVWEIQWERQREIQWKIHCFYKFDPSLLEQSNQTLPRRDLRNTMGKAARNTVKNTVFTNTSHPSWNNPIKLCQGEIGMHLCNNLYPTRCTKNISQWSTMRNTVRNT